MSESSRQRLRIVEGLPSLRQWMVDELSSEFDVVASDVWEEGDADGVDVVLLDVDAAGNADRLDLEEIAALDGVHFVCCGVEKPPELDGSVTWLPRPFGGEVLRQACRRERTSTDSDNGLTFDDETHDVEPPEEFVVDDTTPDDERDPPAEDDTTEQSTVVSDVVEIDDTSSMIVDVQDVDGANMAAGEWVGDIRREAVDIERALERADNVSTVSEESEQAPGRRTMPEVPVEDVDESSEPSRPGSSGASVRPGSRGTDARRHGGSSSVSQLVSTLAEPVRRAISNTSELLAGGWQRLSLVAREDDRARRVRRLLIKTFADGEDAGRRELDRIPHESGMSGDLGVLSVRTLCDAIATEEQRGRLEIHGGGETVVLYLDGDRLDAVEDLGGREDELLLECLQDLGAIDDQEAQELRARVNEEMSPPIRMVLRQEAIVDDDVILQARRARAHRMLRPLVDRDDGFFTFARVSRDEDSSWPPEPLRLPVHDALGPPPDDPSSSTSLHGEDVRESAAQREGTIQADVPSGLSRREDSDPGSTAERASVDRDDDPTEDL